MAENILTSNIKKTRFLTKIKIMCIPTISSIMSFWIFSKGNKPKNPLIFMQVTCFLT